MGWAWLAATIALEITGTTMMKLSYGFTVLWPSIAAFLCYAGTVVGLIMALRELPLSVAYAVWAGAGTAITALIGITWFDEPAPAAKLLSLLLVLIGIVGLQLSMTAAGPR